MTVQTVLLTIGHYLLLAAGLIFLLLILLLAAALILTFFIRLFADISIRSADPDFKKRINVRFKILFFEYVLFDLNDFENEDESADPDDNENETGCNDSELPKDSGKSIYHVVVTDEKIRVQTTESKQHSNDYEIIVHTDEIAVKDIEISNNSDEVVSFETSEIISETEDVITLTSDEAENLIIENETVEKSEPVSAEYEINAAGDDAEETGDDENETDSDFFDDLEDLSDLSGTYSEIKRYVDLSDPALFVSDSIGAAYRISKALGGFVGDVMLRTDIDEMEADIIYGLSDPASTAMSFGAVHSFKASIYAYLVDVEENTRSSKKRNKAGELGAIIRDDIRVVPDLANQTFEVDTDISFSFRISRIYIPTLRFLLNKNMRWVLRKYVYKYFIKQIIKTWKEDRRQNKASQKAQHNPENDFSDCL